MKNKRQTSVAFRKVRRLDDTRNNSEMVNVPLTFAAPMRFFLLDAFGSATYLDRSYFACFLSVQVGHLSKLIEQNAERKFYFMPAGLNISGLTALLRLHSESLNQPGHLQAKPHT